jgi:hypothetical protein
MPGILESTMFSPLFVTRAEKPKAIKLAKSASGFSGNNLSPAGGRKL